MFIGLGCVSYRSNTNFYDFHICIYIKKKIIKKKRTLMVGSSLAKIYVFQHRKWIFSGRRSIINIVIIKKEQESM